MASEIRFLGTTDDVTDCDCCGKKHLKSTVALSIDGGDPVYYGVVCASLALRRPGKEIRSESRKVDQEKARREAAERQAAWEAANAPWFAFLAANGRGSDTFSRIESLGGFAAARAAFRAAQVAA